MDTSADVAIAATRGRLSPEQEVEAIRVVKPQGAVRGVAFTIKAHATTRRIWLQIPCCCDGLSTCPHER